MNVNFIIKNIKDRKNNKTTSFEINGYIMNINDFYNKRSINGEFINLEMPIKGSYDKYFRNGVLNINKTIYENNYILIKIDSSSHSFEDEIIIEILAMSKKDGNYIMPINNYITDIYDSSENKSYQIIFDEEDDLKNKEIMVEFIPDCNRVTIDNEDKSIKMQNIYDNNGLVQKFRVTGFNDNFILKVKVPQDISHVTYIIKYYFSEGQKEQNYKLNKEFSKKIVNQKNDIIFEFNKLEITNNNNNTIDREMLFKIYGFLYTDENDIKNELFNSSNNIQERIFKNYTFIPNDTNFSLYFSDFKSKSKNCYIFNLRIKIIVSESGYAFNEHFLIYTLPVNLEKELKVIKSLTLSLIIILSLLVFVIFIIIIFSIGLIKLKKKNTNLKEKVLSTSFASGKIDENIIEKDNSKKDDNNVDMFI